MQWLALLFGDLLARELVDERVRILHCSLAVGVAGLGFKADVLGVCVAAGRLP
jgi:hypothetical protein